MYGRWCGGDGRRKRAALHSQPQPGRREKNKRSLRGHCVTFPLRLFSLLSPKAVRLKGKQWQWHAQAGGRTVHYGKSGWGEGTTYCTSHSHALLCHLPRLPLASLHPRMCITVAGAADGAVGNAPNARLPILHFQLILTLRICCAESGILSGIGEFLLATLYRRAGFFLHL